MLVVHDREPPGHGVRQGRAMRRLHAYVVGIGRRVKEPVSYVNITFRPVKIRLVADVVDQTAGRITAIERALRPFQYFRATDIKHGEGLRLGNGNIAFVEVHRGGRLDDVVKVILGGAADGELGILAGQIATDVNAGAEGRNVKTFLDTQYIHLFPGERSNGDAHILQALLAFLGGHHHLFQHPLRQRRVGGKYKRRHDQWGTTACCCPACCCKYSGQFHVSLSDTAYTLGCVAKW